MRVVEAAAVDADDDLRPRRVERFALQPLDRLAADLAVEMPGARARLESRERRLVCGPSGQDDEAASASGSGGTERDRLGRTAEDDPGPDAAAELDLVVEEHRPLGIGLGRRVPDELERLAWKVEENLPALVLEDRSQLDEVGDEPAQPAARREPPVGERHRHPCAFVPDPELAADRARRRLVEDVRVDVGIVTGRRQEPRLDCSPAADTLNPPAALRKPDVAQAATEEPALPLVLGDNTEGAEALVDRLGIDALAVVRADELVPPAPQRRHVQAAQRRLPRLQEVGIGGADSELDPAALATGCGDRRVGVRYQLGNDLGQVDPGLREVLAEVASTNPAVAQFRCVDRHEQRIGGPKTARLLSPDDLAREVEQRPRPPQRGSKLATGDRDQPALGRVLEVEQVEQGLGLRDSGISAHLRRARPPRGTSPRCRGGRALARDQTAAAYVRCVLTAALGTARRVLVRRSPASRGRLARSTGRKTKMSMSLCVSPSPRAAEPKIETWTGAIFQAATPSRRRRTSSVRTSARTSTA